MHGLFNFVFYNQEYSIGFSVSAIASTSHKLGNGELKITVKYSSVQTCHPLLFLKVDGIDML